MVCRSVQAAAAASTVDAFIVLEVKRVYKAAERKRDYFTVVHSLSCVNAGERGEREGLYVLKVKHLYKAIPRKRLCLRERLFQPLSIFLLSRQSPTVPSCSLCVFVQWDWCLRLFTTDASFCLPSSFDLNLWPCFSPVLITLDMTRRLLIERRSHKKPWCILLGFVAGGLRNVRVFFCSADKWRGMYVNAPLK